MTIPKILLFVASLALLLTACGGNETAPLATANEPTLVYIYTDA